MRIAPIALGLMLGAGLSDRFVHRFGTNRVVAAAPTWPGWRACEHLVLVGDDGLLGNRDQPDRVAFAMGNIVAPATDAVMGAVPEAKAGVGSAMNDVTRQVGERLVSPSSARFSTPSTRRRSTTPLAAYRRSGRGSARLGWRGECDRRGASGPRRALLSMPPRQKRSLTVSGPPFCSPPPWH